MCIELNTPPKINVEITAKYSIVGANTMYVTASERPFTKQIQQQQQQKL